jgi:hypothetical protein
MCGSCWAFSTIASVESQNFLVNGGKMEKLSEQFILDCGWTDNNSACFGGEEAEAGRSLLSTYNGFIPYDSAYGNYMSTDSYCKYVDGMAGVNINSWVSLPESYLSANVDGENHGVKPLDLTSVSKHDQLIMRALVQHGLVSISIKCADEITYYRSWIIRSDNCGNTKYDDLDHAVNLVGYGTAIVFNSKLNQTESVDYWLVKNSWSNNWGEEGYFKIERGTGRDCGVTLAVSFPIISNVDGKRNKTHYSSKRPKSDKNENVSVPEDEAKRDFNKYFLLA